MTESNSASATLAFLRRILLALFILGVVVTITDLLLLEHTEGWQLTPLILLATSLVVVVWFVLSKSKASVRMFQATMVLFILGGITGIALHYNGNVEFELEMYPALSGLDLFKKSIQGAFPALAPGMMIHLGLIGLAYTYRHPALKISHIDESIHKGE